MKRKEAVAVTRSGRNEGEKKSCAKCRMVSPF